VREKSAARTRPWTWRLEAERLRAENAWLRERLAALRLSRRALLALLAYELEDKNRQEPSVGRGRDPMRARLQVFSPLNRRSGGPPLNSGPDPMRSP
jgi:hypothetical protein